MLKSNEQEISIAHKTKILKTKDLTCFQAIMQLDVKMREHEKSFITLRLYNIYLHYQRKPLINL